MMRRIRIGKHLIVSSALLLPFNSVLPAEVVAQEPSVDARARETEQMMTDEERFSLVVSFWGPNPLIPA